MSEKPALEIQPEIRKREKPSQFGLRNLLIAIVVLWIAMALSSFWIIIALLVIVAAAMVFVIRRFSQQDEATSDVQPFQFTLRRLFLFVTWLCVTLAAGAVHPLLAWPVGLIGLGFCISLCTGRVRYLALSVGLLAGSLVIALPIINANRPMGHPRTCSLHTSQICLALMHYEAANQRFPPPYTVDANGNSLHSWRTLILPYLEEELLYKTIDLNQPWDAPVNAPATSWQLPQYQCPAHPSYGTGTFTSYVAVIGPNTLWPGGRGPKWNEVPDGIANTVLIIEVSRTDIAWAEPRDLTLEEVVAAFHAGDLTGISCYHTGGAHFGFADRHVEFIDPATLDEAKLRALFNINDNAAEATEEPTP